METRRQGRRELQLGEELELAAAELGDRFLVDRMAEQQVAEDRGLGTKILPKLRSGRELQVGIEFSVEVQADLAGSLEADLRHILADLGLADRVRIG